MKTVTMIGTLPPIKGISPYTKELCSELSKLVHIDFIGFKSIYPEFLYPGGTKVSGVKPPKIKNLDNRSFLTWYNPFTWIYAGFTAKGDVVHAQWWSWALAPVYCTVLLIAKLRGKKIVLTAHNIEPHEKSFLKSLFNNSTFSLADKYIVHSENNKATLIKEKKITKTIKIIAHGQIQFPRSKKTKQEIRLNLGFSKTDTVLIFFGNIRDYKGLDILLETLTLLPNNCKLIIAGKPWGSFDRYSSIIDNNKLFDRVVLFTNYLPDKLVADLFRASDVAVFPYRLFEASSGAASLANFYGLTLVVTDVGGLPSLVNNTKLVAKPNKFSLKTAILYAIEHLDILSLSKLPSWSIIAAQTAEYYK